MLRILFISFMLISGVVFNSCKTDQLEAGLVKKQA